MAMLIFKYEMNQVDENHQKNLKPFFKLTQQNRTSMTAYQKIWFCHKNIDWSSFFLTDFVFDLPILG